MAFKTSKWIKCLAVILALCMLCCFTGCNPDEESSDSSSDSSMVDTEPKNIRKVGYIFSGSVSDELSFTGQINEQRIKASNRCSMDTCYIENVEIEDFEAAVKKLADEGCTDIVAAGANFAHVIRAVSGKYLNLNFVGYGNTSSSANTSAYTEHAFQGAYVAGLVATYNCESRDKRRVGVVVDSDLLYNCAVINAVALGSKWVTTNAEIYAASAHTDGEIDQAVNWLIENQCEVIVCYTGSSHSEDYCQSRGVKFIGNLDFSGKEDSYSNMLMYFYCKRDSYYLSQFKKMQLDQWSPDNYVGTMGNGVVMVSKALDGSKKDTQMTMDSLVPYISNGAAYIFSGELMDNTGVVRVFQTDEMSYSEIYSMDWYVQGVQIVQNFRQPSGDYDNPLTVKY